MSVLSGIKNRCAAALRDIKQTASRTEDALTTPDAAVMREALKQAVIKVTPQIRLMLKAKFRSAGLKPGKGKHGGHLLDQIGAAKVQLLFKGTKAALHISMPDGLSSAAYAKAGALNYGSVRQPQITRVIVDLPSNNAQARIGKAGIIGDRAKRTLKQQVLGVKAHSNKVWTADKYNRFVDNVRDGYIGRKARFLDVYHDSRKARRSNSGKSFKVDAMAVTRSYTVSGGELQRHDDSISGQITVIPPKAFFTFTGSEREVIGQMIAAEVQASLQRS